MDHMIPVLPASKQSRANQPRDMSTSRTSSLQTQSSTSSSRGNNEKHIPSRVQFVPGSCDLYGAVNCNDLTKKASTSVPSGRLKSGPPLLEIRRLTYVHKKKYSVYSPGDLDDVHHETAGGDEDVHFCNQKLFDHETVLVSRGISGLGASVFSTCLSFRPLTEQQRQSASLPPVARCATGLTSGALCIHNISNLYGSNNDAEPPSSTVAHYAPRQQRPVTSVAWCSSNSKNSRLVAVGLTGSGGSGGAKAGMSQSSSAGRKGPPIRIASSKALSPTTGGDRDFGCLVWDIEAQGSSSGGGGVAVGKGAAAAVPIKTPAFKFAHNTGVESISWLVDGQLLAVGSQKRNMQLYDLRVSGTNAPPISVFAHSEAVAGIVPDERCSTKSVFASFGNNAGEPVKIWDARMMESTIGEIRAEPCSTNPSLGVSAVAWSPSERQGFLTIAIGDTLKTYDTKTPGSRSLPVEVSYTSGDGDYDSLQDFAFQPVMHRSQTSISTQVLPSRILVVTSKGDTDMLAESHVAPLSVSNRDGRIAHSLGGSVWIGGTTEGPSAMEGKILLASEDISARMMRRARCLDSSRYSTDPLVNIKMLEDEQKQLIAQHQSYYHEDCIRQTHTPDFNQTLTNINQLTRLWRWVLLVEELCRLDQRDGDDNVNSNNSSLNFSSTHSYITEESWTARGLHDAGILKLLRMSSRDGPEDNTNWMDSKSTSDVLLCDEYDSPMRRAALNACGWVKKYGSLRNLLDECENRGEHERAAALAIWHGNLGECVASLQRGAEVVKANGTNGQPKEAYAETLSLIAMVVAGFSRSTSSDGSMQTSTVWTKACESLLHRPDISPEDTPGNELPSQGVAYLRAICTFLLNIGDGFDRTIHDESLSLADRVGVSIRFLSRSDLRSFLDQSLRKCLKIGDLGGIVITGLDKRGVAILSSYIDKTSDVQTAALVVCRVMIPSEWSAEKRMCAEWLECYRALLNNLQLWHSRAAFDVGRNEIIRRLNASSSSNARRSASSKKPQRVENEATFPPQIWARCNYCNTSLPLSKLRRQDGIVANSWLSRQKPVLTCCPTCKKPLPRCSICLLSMGCLNPYLELQRERNQYPRGGSGQLLSGGGSDDLSGLANIPFAEWFTWCMRCKHGGHAHHLLVWFSKHPTCAVSGCDCHCQFDGIQRLKRPT